MYSYKLNNSYTVYVNYAYLNECIKASKEWAKHHPKHICSKPAKSEKKHIDPLPENTILTHKSFGFGKVVSTDKSGIMSVEFNNRTVRFLFPEALHQGYLSLSNKKEEIL